MSTVAPETDVTADVAAHADGDRSPSSEDRSTRALGELLRPIRGRIIAACVCQAVGALAGVVPFIAVAELGRVLLVPGPVNPSRAAGLFTAHASGQVKKALQDDVNARGARVSGRRARRPAAARAGRT